MHLKVSAPMANRYPALLLRQKPRMEALRSDRINSLLPLQQPWLLLPKLLQTLNSKTTIQTERTRTNSAMGHPTRDLKRDYHRVKARKRKVGKCKLNRIIYRPYPRYPICTVDHPLVKANIRHRQ